MIFVTLGTVKWQFSRPLIEIEKAVKQNLINEEIIVQNGYTPFESKFLKTISFLSTKEIDEMYKKASVVIVQGGTGSIIKGVKLGKKIIVVPRLKKYNEHIDDHQLEITNEMAKQNQIIPWYEKDNIVTLLEKTKKFYPAPFISGRDKIISELENFIDNI